MKLISIRCAAEMLVAERWCLAVPDSAQVTCEFTAPTLEDPRFFQFVLRVLKHFYLFGHKDFELGTF